MSTATLYLARLGLPGKLDPALFAEAARRLGARPARCVVVEEWHVHVVRPA